MATLKSALELAAMGFKIFAVNPGAKTPVFKRWQDSATSNADLIAKGWNEDYNIGVLTGEFNGGALLVVDVDNKGDKRGDDTVFMLDMEGFDFPPTFEVLTPTGGRHLFYSVPQAVKQGVEVFGPGVDIRSKGGYVVGVGSEIGGKFYTVDKALPIAPAPQWMIDKCGVVPERAKKRVAVAVDPALATAEAISYLDEAQRAIEGQGGDITAFKVACGVRGKGVSEDECLQLMLNNWNDYCEPPWPDEELAVKVANAYAHAQNAQGAEAVSADLEPVAMDVGEKPARKPRASKKTAEELVNTLGGFNAEYAVVTLKGNACVLHEFKDFDGNDQIEYMAERSFTLSVGHKKDIDGKSLAKQWLEWEGRRTYKGAAFRPDVDMGDEYYNLWRGLAVTPAASADHPMVERWKEHALQNVCRGDKVLYQWLVSWFANLVQNPGNKQAQPVALVFKGSKGVGKNALVERISHLLGRGSAITASDGRYVTGNFNSHLEKCILMVLDEAYWSGDKRAEGKLKDLITGANHLIERKGFEPYECKNHTRVCIIGNEEWLVPASEDERRYAVFNVGNGRKQDTKYFEELRIGLDEKGGDAHLLRFLLDFDISGVNLKVPPQTEGLNDQKLESLSPVREWWHECLSEGRIVESEAALEWGEDVPTSILSNAVANYYRRRGIRNRVPNLRSILADLKLIGADSDQKRLGKSREAEAGCSYVRVFKPLGDCRKAFSAWIGIDITWEE